MTQTTYIGSDKHIYTKIVPERDVQRIEHINCWCQAPNASCPNCGEMRDHTPDCLEVSPLRKAVKPKEA